MVLTASFVLSPVTVLVCHRHQRIKVLSKPGRADFTSANLTPASGRQDHTTSPSASQASLVSVLLIAHKSFDSPCDPIARKTLPRPLHPVPNVRDDRDTPLLWDGMAGVLEVILGGAKTEIFLQRGLDCPNQIENSQQIKSVIPGCATWAQARNPYSRSWLWIPGSRSARPGMTAVIVLSTA